MKDRDMSLQMTELAKAFPCMESKFQSAFSNGLAPWDARHLAQVAASWSAGERLVVSFLLTVWDAEQVLFPPFNVVDVLRRWDDEHWNAFGEWVKDPFSC